MTIAFTGLSGVSDPTRVLLDPDGTVHKQLPLCFHAVPAGADAAAEPRPEGIETKEAVWCTPAALARPHRTVLARRGRSGVGTGPGSSHHAASRIVAGHLQHQGPERRWVGGRPGRRRG